MNLKRLSFFLSYFQAKVVLYSIGKINFFLLRSYTSHLLYLKSLTQTKQWAGTDFFSVFFFFTADGFIRTVWFV